MNRNFTSQRSGSNLSRGNASNFSSRNSSNSRVASFSSGNRGANANFVSRNFSHNGNFNAKSASHNANFAGKGNNFQGGNFKGGNWNNHSGNWNHNGNGNRGGNWNRGWGNWYGYGRNGYYGGWGWGLGWPYWGWGLGLGLGWPYWGYGGLGYGWGGGWGYGGWGGYSYPYAYGGYGYPANSTYAYAYDNPVTDPAASATTTPQLPPDATQPPAATEPSAEALEYVSRGEQLFQAGQYQDALRQWQHSMVENPNNGAMLLLSAQALFALGQYEPAANTVQMAMQVLPENEWGNLVKNYSQIYPDIGNYTNQLKALETARDAKPDDPALRFLLGYHFGYLGYPKQAVRELDKALDLQPKDIGAQKLREIFASLAGLPARAATPPPEPNVQQGQPAEPADVPRKEPPPPQQAPGPAPLKTVPISLPA